jgi:hypothetical protein
MSRAGADSTREQGPKTPLIPDALRRPRSE